jgi:hypothetical protein
MSVLESMRSSSDSTFMQVLLVLIVISFVGWMALPQADKTVAVAQVNGVKIMDTKYRQLYSRERAFRERQRDRGLTEAEEKSLSEEVRQQLIRNEVVLQEAERMGLVVSNFELQWEIVRVGQLVGFADDTGKIDQQRYNQHLTRSGLTQGAFENQLAEQLLLDKVRSLVFMGTTISEPVLRKLYETNQRKVSVTYAQIRPQAFHDAITITDADIDAWLAANDAEARATFEKDFERRFKHPERLELAMILLGTENEEKPADLLPRMNAIRAELLAGADFGQMARKWSEHASAEQDGTFGLKPTMKLDVAMTDAVEGVEVGDITRVVTTETDVRIYKVLQRIEASEDTYEVASRTIAKEALQQEQAPTLAVEFAEKELLPKWKELGAPPVDLLAQHDLTTQTTRLLAATDPPPPFGPPREVVTRAMDASVDAVIDEVFESGGRYFVAQVAQKVEADLAQFEAQRETIRGQELLTRRSQFLENWVTDRVAAASVE